MRRFLLVAIPISAFAASDFDTAIRPILNENCGECHSAKAHTSGFSVATLDSVLSGGNKYGPSVSPGSPERSPLVKILKGELTPRMPFGKSLSDVDIASIEQWIKELKAPAPKAAEWRWPY